MTLSRRCATYRLEFQKAASVLGSTLFALYINPLLKIITQGSVLAYADDITIVSSGATLQEAKASSETALASICSWSASNGFIMNTAKCYTMYIAPCSRGPAENACNLKLNGAGFSIDTVGKLKILGVTITSDLNWSFHAKNVRQSVTKMISVLNRFGCSLNSDVRCRILNAFIIPKLNNCQPVWCQGSKGEEKAINHVLLRAAKIVRHNKTAELNVATYHSINILSFHISSAIKCLNTVHTLLQCDDAAEYLPPLFTVERTQSQRSTRSAEGYKFVLPRHTLSSVEQCFDYQAAKLWNSLPFTITNLANSNNFHNLSSKHILLQLAD